MIFILHLHDPLNGNVGTYIQVKKMDKRTNFHIYYSHNECKQIL